MKEELPKGSTLKILPEARRRIIERVLLAKLLLGQGSSHCADTNDPMRFSQGLLSLQDAVELALGALASHLGAKLKSRNAFYDYFKEINAVLEAKGLAKLPSEKDLCILNDARVQVKHSGILQHPEEQRKHVILVDPFIKHLSGMMGLDFDSLSLSDAIGVEDVRAALKDAEMKLVAADYRGCAESLTIAQYRLFGYRFNLGPYLKQEGLVAPAPEIHWEDFRSENEVWLLRHGIDVADFYRLRSVIPEWGVSGKKREIVLWWEGRFCHEGNWSSETLRWGINFTIDMALKLERPHPNEGLLSRMDCFIYRITAVKDDVEFFNHYQPDDDWDNVLSKFRPPKRPILRLPKGEFIEGFAWRDKEHPLAWTVASKALPEGTGVILAESVDVEEIRKS